jgi:dihydroorotate dehydrogenase (fumarate)
MMSTKWLGLELKNPFVPSASPLSRSLDAARQLEDAGAAAIVMYSLFEEEVRTEAESMVHFLHHQELGHSEAVDFLPDQADFPSVTDRYLEHIAALKSSLEIPVIASINGTSNSGWLEHAIEIQDAGADALELNVYYVASSPWEESSDVEQRYVDLLKTLKEDINIPINMKLSPFFSSIGHMVKRLENAGADGVSLFNRFYQPDINIHSMSLQHSLHPSSSQESLLAMRWIAMLYQRVGCSLGATGGVHTGEDAIKLLLAGADVVHLCTALLQKGPELLTRVINELEEWMEEQNFETIHEFRGRVSQLSVVDTAAFERVNYIRVLDNYSFKPGGRT